jgi:ribosomal-protein-alanine N-acetyltransferase
MPQIRRLIADDSTVLHEIEKRVYSEPWSETLIKDSLMAPMTYGLALCDGAKILAYAIYQVILSEGHILNLATAQEFQRQGLGTRLIDAVIEDCRNKKALQIFLEVRVSNESAQRLYRKKSFQPLMIREKYYSNSESALLMVRTLKENEVVEKSEERGI